MRKSRAELFVVALVALGAGPSSGQAQILYPAGYGGWGWGGWGVGNQLGAQAAGLGWLAAGQGAYNLQSAQAKSINVNTMMHYNEYMYQSLKQEQARALEARRRQSQVRSDALAATQDRLRNAPTPRDIESGAALNVALVELLDPRYSHHVARFADIPVDARIVQNIRFRNNTDMVAHTLDQLTHAEPRGLLAEAQYADAVKSYRQLSEEINSQLEEKGVAQAATVGAFRSLLEDTLARVRAQTSADTNQRLKAIRTLKSLVALCYLFNDTSGLEVFLAGLGERKSVSLGNFLGFMRAFNLSFGPAENPTQINTYNTIYQKFVELRDLAFGTNGTGTLPLDPQPPLDPAAVEDFFDALNPEELSTERRNQFPPRPPAPADEK